MKIRKMIITALASILATASLSLPTFAEAAETSTMITEAAITAAEELDPGFPIWAIICIAAGAVLILILIIILIAKHDTKSDMHQNNQREEK